MASPFVMLPLAANTDSRLSFRQLKTLTAICSFRRSADDFCVEAGRDEIASRCGFNASIVSTATTELQRLGWLVKQGAGGRAAGGGGLKTTYTITIPETVSNYATVAESETVLESATVSESTTVPESVSTTVSTSGTPLYRKEVNTDGRVSELSAESNGFAEFWQQYPKKVAKPDALKAWRKVKPSGRLLADLMAGLAIHKVSDQWRKNGGEFIPHPATWLNKRRWEDEIQTAQSADAEDSLFAGAL